MPVNIFGSESNLIKPRGPPGKGFKLLDKEENYGMQNKRLANVATSIENCDVITRGEVNSIVNEADEKHEELFQNLIVVNATSEKHDEQLKQLDDKITSTSEEMLINLSNHKDSQNVLLRETRENINIIDNKTTSLQETISLNYNYLNEQIIALQNEEFVTDAKLIYVTDKWNRINGRYNEARLINILADAERSSYKVVEDYINEKVATKIDDIKDEISILSDLVKDITINAVEIERVKQQIESIRKALNIYLQK